MTAWTPHLSLKHHNSQMRSSSTVHPNGTFGIISAVTMNCTYSQEHYNSLYHENEQNRFKETLQASIFHENDNSDDIGRPIYRQIHEYLEPARTALCWRTMLP
jgi:hypothetical protein